MLIASVPWDHLVQLIWFALGVTYAITRSEIGFLVRWPWCRATLPLYRRIGRVISPWSLVLCPPCNAWWAGGALAWLAGYDWWTVAQFAFSTLLAMAVLQMLGGGDIAPADDFESILGLKEAQDGE
jgi:hypothetical protein